MLGAGRLIQAWIAGPSLHASLPAGAAAPVYAPYTEHYPPDTPAISLWLRNRQPAKWRDRQEVNHTGTIDQRIAAMTPEERARDAVELVGWIRAGLAAFRTIEHEPEE